MMSSRVNFLNSWLKLLNQKHSIWKNNEAQFPTNQMLKNEIEKNNFYLMLKDEQKKSKKLA
jgi:hypothetical protein